jgi:hypothetical protein
MGPQSVTSETRRTRSGILYALATFFMNTPMVAIWLRL